jgi:hypothetical protein
MASLRKLGFKKLCDLKVDPDGKISREFAKPKQYQYVVYAFVVGKKVMYIGKARDLWRRFNTYRNCITWSSPMQSNIDKTRRIIDTIKTRGVSLYVLECPTLTLGIDRKSITVTTMNIKEPELIHRLSPPWNIHYT